MSEHPTSEPAVQARPAGPTSPPGSESAVSHGLRWVPLLTRRLHVVVLAIGVVIGVAAPILLWFNLPYQGTIPFYQHVGFLLVVVGLGLAIVGLTLVLGEAARLERTSTSGAGVRVEQHPDSARGMTGARVFALIGVVVLVVGAFLLRPPDRTEPVDDRGSSQGSGNGG